MNWWIYIPLGIFLSLIMTVVLMMIPGAPELDHLHFVEYKKIDLRVKQQFKLNNIDLVAAQNSISLKYKGKQIFLSTHANFISVYQSQGQIKSQGDSFYKIKDKTIKSCNQQVINAIQFTQPFISIFGFFADCNNTQYSLKIHQNSQQDLEIQFSLTNPQFNRIQLHFNDQNDTVYYGLGQQFSYLSLGRNRPYSTFVRQKGVGRSAQPLTLLSELSFGVGGNYYYTYIPTPIWMSNNKVGYVVDSFAYISWINNRVRIWDNSVVVKIISKNSLKEIVSQITKYNGYTKPVPKWVNEGSILGLQGGSSSVREKYLKMKSSGAKISGLWIQDWVSKRMSLGYSRLWWVWELDNNHYQNWTNFKHQADGEDVKILIYLNPMITNPESKKGIVKNYFKEGLQNGYFVTGKGGKIFETSAFSDFKAHLIDFNRQEGIDFFKRIVNSAIDETGAQGMMVDFAQSYPVENMQTLLEQSIKNHNKYPTKYHQAVNEILIQRFGKNHTFYVFSRAGYLHTPKHTNSIWAGDQNMDYGFHTGLKSCLTAILSSGLVGFSNTHCDIGGYTYIKILGIDFSSRTQDLMIKSMQLSAFSPVFRTHQGNSPNVTLQVYSNIKLRTNFAFYSRLFSILSAYREEQTEISLNQKLPLLRPIFLHHDDNYELSEVQDQFYLGNHILVSPYLSPQNTRSYYLPKGNWIDLWNGNMVTGCDCWRISSGQLPPVYINKESKFSQSLPSKIKLLVSEIEQILTAISSDSKKEDIDL